ncbi:hypothetical protein ASPZODRAFT_19387 [Penicilliopsis zonata CBS 506.65]|uniref:F-box domain-containing protein n=1 Tax=Penicilliopsis zonata CBS 506.65 TaxID=1073090 RepID=A0A1L9S930_9EURO|nr:hypothetical protein ASPZODRAFT_19387 [Penicilliopsis zonata CBS 506.65]OJJ43670.1 hypothetical protein ASPZODRAFT_19387 [Penicilliopsis zonata CBS 506.65]
MASLSALPVEIKLHFLYALCDLYDLRAVIHACPSFHAIYVSNRRNILSCLLARSIPFPVIVDAVGAALAKRWREIPCDFFDRTSLKNLSQEFISQYHALLSLIKPYEPHGQGNYAGRAHPVTENQKLYDRHGLGLFGAATPFTDAELVHMTRLYFIVHDVADDMAQSALTLASSLSSSSSSSSSSPPSSSKQGYDETVLPLSPSEIRRLHRVLYRMETFRYLFKSYPDFEGLRLVHLEMECHVFFQFFHPWEIEEMLCFRDYAYRTFSWVSDDMHYDLEALSFDGTAMESIGDGLRERWRIEAQQQNIIKNSSSSSEEEEEGSAFDGFKEHCMSLGLEFLLRWLKAAKENDQTVGMAKQFGMIRRRLRNVDYFDPFFIALTQEYTHRYRREIDGSVFGSDDDWDAPNLAWTWLVNRETSRLCAQFPSLLPWGYVFWDAERLQRMQVEEELTTLGSYAQDFAPFA